MAIAREWRLGPQNAASECRWRHIRRNTTTGELAYSFHCGSPHPLPPHTLVTVAGIRVAEAGIDHTPPETTT